MALEAATYISDLNTANPTGSDAKSQGDDHLRLLKSTIKATFPNITGAVTPTHTQLNLLISSSLGTSGYQKFASGLIMQWGISSVNASSVLVVNLPISFPTAVFVAVASGYGTTFAPGSSPMFGATSSLSQITLQNMYSASNASVAWVVLGN